MYRKATGPWLGGSEGPVFGGASDEMDAGLGLGGSFVEERCLAPLHPVERPKERFYFPPATGSPVFRLIVRASRPGP